MIRFGPSGNSENFYVQGNKSSVQMPEWLRNLGLNAYEYQCSKGLNIGENTAKQLGQKAVENGIMLSIHAPYYINMSSIEDEKRENSKKYVLATLKVAKWMKAERIVIHTGSTSGVERNWALETAKAIFREVILEADDAGFSQITLCPEVLGKLNQLGSLEEILSICQIDERIIPTIDFGHLHARGMGCLNTVKDFEAIIEIIEDAIGYDRLKRIHVHFSRIEYTKGGEKKHRSMKETLYGPEFEHLAEIIIKKNLEPVIICESREDMAEDALLMKGIYEALRDRG